MAEARIFSLMCVSPPSPPAASCFEPEGPAAFTAPRGQMSASPRALSVMESVSNRNHFLRRIGALFHGLPLLCLRTLCSSFSPNPRAAPCDACAQSKAAALCPTRGRGRGRRSGRGSRGRGICEAQWQGARARVYEPLGRGGPAINIHGLEQALWRDSQEARAPASRAPLAHVF